MAEVTYDGRSFEMDGRRVWLVSGSVPYYRIPAGLWQDRLLKARQAGLNCVSTRIMWNYHELTEGQWDFQGQQDIAEFVRVAGELGLYVILKPGPYVDGDWDFGGLPGWLGGKSGMAYRSSNAAYTHYYDKYFHNVLPRLAEHQVTREGNIVLIQNEQDYVATTMPDRTSYLEFVSQLFRRSGFDIPIITANQRSEPYLEDGIETVTGGPDVLGQAKQLRDDQRHAPLMVSELSMVPSDIWGGEHHTCSPRTAARRAMEVLGCGAMYNIHPFHGGTNFGFWGGRLDRSHASFQTASYDCDAPIAEGGALTEKYYLLRLVNLFARYMGPFVAESEMSDRGAVLCDGPLVMNLTGPAARWVFVSNGGQDEMTEATVYLPGVGRKTVSLSPLGAVAIPLGVRLTDKHVLGYANCMPLGFFGRKLLVFHGPGGWQADIEINGKRLTAEIPDGGVDVIAHQGINVALLSSDLARTVWPEDGRLLIGPTWIGLEPEDVIMPKSKSSYDVIDLDGKVSQRKAPKAAGVRAQAPRLGKWTTIDTCVEPSGEAEWMKLDRPREMDRIGEYRGYVWYRIRWEEIRARKRDLYLPDCEDRATLFLNGDLVGTWGRGEDAQREPLKASVRKGENVLVALADNLGRFSGGPHFGQAKGIFGHVYHAKPLPKKRYRIKEMDGFSKRIVPRARTHLISQLQKMPAYQAEVDLALTKVSPVQMTFTSVPHTFAVFCNERLSGFFENTNGVAWGDLTLAGGLKKGKNRIRLVVWGDVTQKSLGDIRYYQLAEPLSGGGAWSWAPWSLPQGQRATNVKNSQDYPKWFSAKFKGPKEPAPVFLKINGARKGQLYLNGRNVGRFWNIGPQEYWYLPEIWLQEENELWLFDETGRRPQRCTLSLCPHGPFGA